MDLIVGSRRETLDDVRATLDSLLSLENPPPHISCYALTAEPGTPLGQDPARHPDEDRTADAYDLVGQTLEGNGYAWEEISNWARPGHECRHNWLYWEQGNYRGFGSAAHSHADGHRFWNVRTPNRYIEMLAKGVAPLGGSEDVDERARRFERESLALRTRRGVSREAFDDVTDFGDLVEIDGDVVRLSVKGRLVANQIIVRLKSAG
jgi:oxygen-independent coproporphyrinogen-3 oxidase